MVGATNDKIYRYTLSIAWDLGTASYDGAAKDLAVGTEDGAPQGIAFKSDGTRLYMVGRANDKVYQYTLSTAWDLDTASYDGAAKDLAVRTEDAAPQGISFKSDGTRLYMVGQITGKVYRYTLSIAWDLGTASYDGNFATFDFFVPNPVANAIYEAPEFDIDFDDRIRVWADIISALGPGETLGVADPALEIDYRKAAGAFDGFEPWSIGNLEARFIKQRLNLDTAKGVAKVTGFKPTVDLLERSEGAKDVAIAPGGTAIAFAKRFHFTPRVAATADATSALIATKEGVTVTGFTAHVFDSGGADVGGNIDWEARGA